MQSANVVALETLTFFTFITLLLYLETFTFLAALFLQSRLQNVVNPLKIFTRPRNITTVCCRLTVLAAYKGGRQVSLYCTSRRVNTIVFFFKTSPLGVLIAIIHNKKWLRPFF